MSEDKQLPKTIRLVETRETSSSAPSGFSLSVDLLWFATLVLTALLLFTDISANVNTPFIILLIHRIAVLCGIFRIRKVSFTPQF